MATLDHFLLRHSSFSLLAEMGHILASSIGVDWNLIGVGSNVLEDVVAAEEVKQTHHSHCARERGCDR